MSWCRSLVLLFFFGLVSLGYLFINDILFRPVLKDEDKPQRKWFGPGEPKEVDKTIRRFVINVSDEELQRLNKRLHEDVLRLAQPVEDVGFSYGFNPDYLRDVAFYWKDKYDWKKAEESLNKLDQYVTNIDGIMLHFIHSKPKSTKGKRVLPLLLVHGWPGSIAEFTKIIPMLTDPVEGDLAFEVVAPSIPGYGFSSQSFKEGLDASQTARIFKELMTERLGYEKFYTQGGDWGSFITSDMAIFYPESVLGYHTNFAQVFSLGSIVKKMLVTWFPSLYLNEDEMFMLGHYKNQWVKTLSETGYLHIQATKPDTIGASLVTSPLGLAAWILEKFSLDPIYNNLNKRDGGLEESRISMDDLLTNVMIYWINRNGASAGRFYYENFGRKTSPLLTHGAIAIEVPTGISVFPNELAIFPRCLLENRFKNIMSYDVMSQGGHFAAFEVPDLLAKHFIAFVQKVESRRMKSSEKKNEL